MGKVIKPFSYTRVQDQGVNYLKHRFDKIRRQQAEQKAAAEAKVQPIRKQGGK